MSSLGWCFVFSTLISKTWFELPLNLSYGFGLLSSGSSMAHSSFSSLHVSLRLNVVLFGMPVAVPFLCAPLPLLLDEATCKGIWCFFFKHHVIFIMEVKGMGHYFKISDFPLRVCQGPCSPVEDLACLKYALTYPSIKYAQERWEVPKETNSVTYFFHMIYWVGWLLRWCLWNTVVKLLHYLYKSAKKRMVRAYGIWLDLKE